MKSQDLTLELGQLSFWSSHDPIRLSSRLSLLLSDIVSCNVSQDARLDPKNFKNAAAWVKRGAGLRFNINIEAEGVDLDDSAKEAFIEGIGGILKNAEIWSQLLLDISLSISAASEHTASRIGTIILSVTHQDNPFETKIPFLKNRKLLSANVELPHGVFSGSLREVNVDLLFSVTTQKAANPFKRQKTDSSREKLKDSPEREALDDMLDKIHKDRAAKLDQGLSDPSAGVVQCLSLQGSAGLNDGDFLFELVENEEMLDLSDSQVFVQNTSVEDTKTDVSSLQEDSGKHSTNGDVNLIERTCAARGFPQSISQSNKRNAEQNQSESTSLNLTASVKLVDAMIRQLICGSDLRLGTGIKSSQILESPPLSEISPTLFSPGYLPAVAQRSQLLGRIANSITSICHRSKSATFKAGFNRFANTCSHEERSGQSEMAKYPELANQLDKAVLSSELHRRLWTLMQLSLFDGAAARKLKPLMTSLDVTQGREHLQAVMLDQTPSPNPCIALTQNSASSSSQTDADLFSDDGDDDANRSMLDELDFFELAAKDREGLDKEDFSALFSDFDELDGDEDRESCCEDELLEEYYAAHEDDRTLI